MIPSLRNLSPTKSSNVIPAPPLQILQTASELQEQEWEYVMEASCIEIYNNQLRCGEGSVHWGGDIDLDLV